MIRVMTSYVSLRDFLKLIIGYTGIVSSNGFLRSVMDIFEFMRKRYQYNVEMIRVTTSCVSSCVSHWIYTKLFPILVF